MVNTTGAKRRSRSANRRSYRALSLAGPSTHASFLVNPLQMATIPKAKKTVSLVTSSAMISTVFFLPPALRTNIMAAHHALQYALGSTSAITEREQLSLAIKTTLAYVVTFRAKHVLGAGVYARIFSLAMLTLHFSRVAGELMERNLFGSSVEKEIAPFFRILAGSFGLLLETIAEHAVVISGLVIQQSTKLPDMYAKLIDAWNTKRSLGQLMQAFNRMPSALQAQVEQRGKRLAIDKQKQMLLLDLPHIMEKRYRYGRGGGRRPSKSMKGV